MTDTRTPASPRTGLAATLGGFLAGLGAALVVGGLVTSALAALLAFRSPEILSHEQAGLYNAKLFEALLLVEGGGAAAAILGLALRGLRALGVAAALLLVLGLGGALAIETRMRALREDAGGAIDRVAKDDPRRVEFGRLHGAYQAAALLMLAGGVLAIARTAQSPGGRG
jgi:hypothetical protein